jgi:hypothetical protein
MQAPLSNQWVSYSPIIVDARRLGEHQALRDALATEMLRLSSRSMLQAAPFTLHSCKNHVLIYQR